MTPDIDLDALTALLDDASPAPWTTEYAFEFGTYEVNSGDVLVCYSAGTKAQADLIAALRNAAPALLSALTATRAELERLRATNGCPSCAAGGCDEFIHLPAPGRDEIRQLGEMQRDLNDAQFQLGQTRTEADKLRAKLAEVRRLCDNTIWILNANDVRAVLDAAPAAAPQPHHCRSHLTGQPWGESWCVLPPAHDGLHAEAGRRWYDEHACSDEAHHGSAGAGTNSGHCGLCGSDDCPGVPGKGCTPGPFETVEPACGALGPHGMVCVAPAGHAMAHYVGGVVTTTWTNRDMAAGAGDGEQDTATTDVCRSCGLPQPCGFKTPHPIITASGQGTAGEESTA